MSDILMTILDQYEVVIGTFFVEYFNLIGNSKLIFESLVKSFKDKSLIAQLQMKTNSVKFYLTFLQINKFALILLEF
jgi:hypothetical protein